MLSAAVQDKINQTVWRQYPEFRGVKPAVSGSGSQTSQAGAANQGVKLGSPAFTLTYQCKVSLPGGRSLNRWVRVALNDNGDILKISTSK